MKKFVGRGENSINAASCGAESASGEAVTDGIAPDEQPTMQKESEKSAKKRARRAEWKVIAICFAIAFLCITIVSKTSFLYSFHDGADINWFLTVGRGIVNGKVPYKDLFEQKGVLLYMLFALNYIICGNSYIVIYIIQVFCYTLFLYLSYKIITLYASKKYAIFGVILTALVVCCCNAYFSGGGEVEEYCLPMVTYGLYVFLSYVKRGGDKIPLKQVVLCGAFAGCIFWMKYTMLAFYGAFAVCVFIDRCIKKDVKSGFIYAAVFMGALFAVSIPWLIYLGVNGAVDDMLRVYIIDNIFSYSGGATILATLQRMWNSVSKVFKNFLLYALAINSVIYLFKGVNGVQKRYKVYFLIMFCCLFVFQCLINGSISYYHLIMGIFVPLGVAGALFSVKHIWAALKYIGGCIKASVKKVKDSVTYSEATARAGREVDCACVKAVKKFRIGLNARTIILCVIVVGVVSLLCGNCTLAMLFTKESYGQTTLAEILVPEEEDAETSGEEEDISLYLLCYKMRDHGFYAICDETPEFYYFAQNNFVYESYPVLFDETESYVVNGEAHYVVTELETWEEEKDTLLSKYEYTADLSYYHVEFNNKIELFELCLLTLSGLE